jgi:hypothetical protein
MASAFVGREADSRRMHEVYRPVAAMFGAAFEAGVGLLALGQALEAPVRALFG